jgi:hypothetical protein
MIKPLDKCCNGCDAPPQLPSFVLCSVCLAALDAKFRSICKRPSARAEPRPRSWSYDDIKAEFERNKGEL